MSTTIYNAYKISDSALSVSEINALLMPARAALEDEAVRRILRASIMGAYHLLDYRLAILADLIQPSSSEKVCEGSCLTESRWDVVRMIEEDRRSGFRNDLDPGASVCVFGDDSGTYAMLFSNNRHGDTLFEKALGCKEYNYWDNTDHPDDVSEEEWSSRGRRWDELLGPSGVPEVCGATFVLVRDSVPSLFFNTKSIEEILGITDASEPLSRELSSELDDRVFTLALKFPEAEQSPPLPPGSPANLHIRHLNRLRRGEVPEFNVRCDQLRALLPEKYSLAALKEDVEETRIRFMCNKNILPKPLSRGSAGC